MAFDFQVVIGAVLFASVLPAPVIYDSDVLMLDSSTDFDYDCYPNNVSTRNARSGMRDPFTRWPNGIVPYHLDENFDSTEKQMILEGMDKISLKTCIRFISRASHQDYVNIKRNDGGKCSSWHGMQGGPQELGLGIDRCLKSYVVAHELIHTIGFYHEHQRPDRSKYVKVMWRNIDSDRGMDFFVQPNAYTFDVPYDFRSIMHYRWNHAAVDPEKPTLISKIRRHPVPMKPTQDLSEKDVVKINRMYNCYNPKYASEPRG